MQRIRSYDVFRGFLIVGMIFFHVLVNFYSFSFKESVLYFVPVGFMIFLGVVSGQFLAKDLHKSSVIALKLFLIFSFLNLPFFLKSTLNEIFGALLIGDQQKLSFEILLPMSLILIISNLVSKNNLSEKVKQVLFLLPFTVLLFFDFTNIYIYNLYFFLFGLMGLLIGLHINLDKIAKMSDRCVFILLNLLLLGATFLICYLVSPFRSVVVIQVMSLYFLIFLVFRNNKCLEVLGKNSLLIYIIHIFIIKTVDIYFQLNIDSINLVLFLTLIITIFSYLASALFLFLSKNLYNLRKDI